MFSLEVCGTAVPADIGARERVPGFEAESGCPANADAELY
jgi:hypothetical protein